MSFFKQAMRDALTREERLRKENERLLAENALLHEENRRLKAPPPRLIMPQAALLHDKICQNIEGKGIFFGLWEPKDRKGQSLGKAFHVFAAPTDLDPPFVNGDSARRFDNAARAVGARKNWHGHAGIYCKNDTALYAALKDGRAIGKWFIPTRDLLCGVDINGKNVCALNLYRLRNMPAFKKTYVTEWIANPNENPTYYWSCSETTGGLSTVYNMGFASNTSSRPFYSGSSLKEYNQLSCRPVRVELAPTPEPTP